MRRTRSFDTEIGTCPPSRVMPRQPRRSALEGRAPHRHPLGPLSPRGESSCGGHGASTPRSEHARLLALCPGNRVGPPSKDAPRIDTHWALYHRVVKAHAADTELRHRDRNMPAFSRYAPATASVRPRRTRPASTPTGPSITAW